MKTSDQNRQQERERAPAANPWRRLMGVVYESVILFGVIWFADYAFSALTQFRGELVYHRSAFRVGRLSGVLRRHQAQRDLLLGLPQKIEQSARLRPR